MMRMTMAALAAAFLLGTPASAQDQPESIKDTAPKISFGEVIKNARAAWPEPEGSTADEATIEHSVLYTMGFATRILYHEFGHGLVSEFNIPVLGKEEDAVDSFAVLFMIADDEDPELDDMIAAVIDVFFDFGESRDSPWDEHSFDEQRAYSVLCLLVGDDPAGYKQVADDAGMPADRQEKCKYTYTHTLATWKQVLGDHLLGEGEPPANTVDVVWEDPKPENAAVAEMLKASGIGEAVSQQLESTFRIPDELTLRFMNCGEANAYYTPAKKEVSFCYEYAQLIHDNAIKYRTEQKKADPKPTDEELNEATSGDEDDPGAAPPK